MPRDAFGKKVSRNDLCWCGSGKKLKRCHLDRHNQDQLHSAQIHHAFWNAFHHELCSCPDSMKTDCKGKIVRAHTISQRQTLAYLTENGHVFSPAPNLRYNSQSSKVFGHRVSTRKASTFTGFCEYHDHNIFRPIDTKPFDAKVDISFLAAYRALCRELFLKTASARANALLRDSDKGRNIANQIRIQTLISEVLLATNIARQELDIEKEHFDRILMSNSFSDTSFYNCFFDSAGYFACSGTTNPTHYIDGSILQDLNDIRLRSQNLCINALPVNGGLWISLFWLKKNATIAHLINDLANQNCLGISLALCLLYCENIFFRESHFRGLPTEIQSAIFDLFKFGIMDEDQFSFPAGIIRKLALAFPDRPLLVHYEA